jgi:ABC-type antimicrobial peptide transport system permease subunit
MAGRDFGENGESEQGNVIINQRLAHLMGEEGTIGGEIRFKEKSYRIIGITKDHIINNYHALHPEPWMMFCGLRQFWGFALYIKFNDKSRISTVMQSVESLFKRYIDEQKLGFAYRIPEDEMIAGMRGELFVPKLLTGFSVVAILISCFGLLGLIALAAEQRTREIGIRKVFGASVSQVVLLLSKDFLKLAGIACVIAFPVAYLIMSRWLENYEYRIGLYWWIFALAGILTLAIVLGTVGVQTLKAATADPVKAIKTE